MPNETWSGSEDASNKTIIAALHKYIIKHCKNQQYQMSEVTWGNFCLKVADSLLNNHHSNHYDPHTIINYVSNSNATDNTLDNISNFINAENSISYTISDSKNSTNTKKISVTNNTIPNNPSYPNSPFSNSNTPLSNNPFSYPNTTPSNSNTTPSNPTANTTQVWIHRLKYFLSRHPSIFSFTELCTQEPSFLVRSNVRVSLCKDYLSKDGCTSEACKSLHCCKYYVYETCKFAENCSFGHDLGTERNKEILESHYIFLEDEDELCREPRHNKYRVNNTLSLNNTSTNNTVSLNNTSTNNTVSLNNTISLNNTSTNNTSTNNTSTNNTISLNNTSTNNTSTNNTISLNNTSTNNTSTNNTSLNNTPTNNTISINNTPTNNNPTNIARVTNNNTTNNNTTNNNTTNNNTSSNAKLRKQIRYLAHYSISDLSLVFRHDYPHICRFYNNSELGCKYGAEGKKCPALHLCKQAVMGGRCERCRLNHSIHSPQVTALLTRQGFVLSQYTKQASIFADLKLSEEAVEAANQSINQLTNQPINQLANQSNNQSNNQLANQSINQLASQSINQLAKESINQLVKAPAVTVYSIADSRMQNYDSPSGNLVSQSSHLHDNQNNPYDNTLINNHFDNQHFLNNSNNNPYDNHNNHHYDNQTSNSYDTSLANQLTYFRGEEMGEEEAVLYNEAYSNHGAVYNNNNFYNNNTEELYDDCYPPFYYPNNNPTYLSSSTTKESNFYPSSTKESTTFYPQSSSNKQSSIAKALSMTLRQHHMRQRKRIDNCRLRVCKYYNVERGCKFAAPLYCPNLHLCHHFVLGKCIYGGEKCRRSHNLEDPSVKCVLNSNNIDVAMPIEGVMDEIRRRLNMTDDSLSSESESEEEQHSRLASPFTTRSTLTPTACEFTPSKGTTQAPPNINQNNKNFSLKPPSSNINTFVFLDLEATGFQQSKITELSVVAVHRSSIEAALALPIPNKAHFLPRIINKLTLCVNPGKPIERRAAEITGMTSSMLETQGIFSNHTADLFILFIRSLQPPCCLVAHNGRGFDYPLLRHELSCIYREAPLDLYCVDSLVLFRSLCPTEQRTPRKNGAAVVVVVVDKSTTPSKALAITSPNGTPISLCKTFEEEEEGRALKLSKHLSSSLDEVEGGKTERTDWWCCSDLEDHPLNNHDTSPNKLLSSSTSNLTLHDHGQPVHNKLRTDWWNSEDDGDVEEDGGGSRGQKVHSRGSNLATAALNAVKTNGMHVNGLTPAKCSDNEVIRTSTDHDLVSSRLSEDLREGAREGVRKVSYKLAEVHKRVTGEYPDRVHRAEDDSEALLRCFIFTPGALQWSDHNAIPFTLPPNHLS